MLLFSTPDNYDNFTCLEKGIFLLSFSTPDYNCLLKLKIQERKHDILQDFLSMNEIGVRRFVTMKTLRADALPSEVFYIRAANLPNQ